MRTSFVWALLQLVTRPENCWWMPSLTIIFAGLCIAVEGRRICYVKPQACLNRGAGVSVNVVLELFENAGCFWAEEGVSDCVLAPFDMFGGMYGDRYTVTPA